jgi:DNA modification methylase
MKYPCLLTKKINEISSAKYNPRKISDEAMGRLTKSLAEFGNIQPITWNVRTGNVVGGHQRLKVYKAMGKTEVDVWAVDLDEQKEKAANIALNKLSGEFDMPMLKDILEEIDTGDLDMEITGFGMDEIALMMEDAHPEVTEDEVPEVPVDAITKPGDLWLLEEHRLLCGDSTSEKDISILMNGEKATMVFTDPPYALFGNSTGVAGIADDKMVRPFFRDIAKISMLNVEEFGHIYICCDWHTAFVIQSVVCETGLTAKNLCIWDKGDGGIGANYQQCYEMIWFFTNSPKAKGTLGKKKTGEKTVNGVPNIWRFKRVTTERQHNAQKPIGMVSVPISSGSEKGELIAEWFGGSGTTLIAAEQLGRKCYAMEISPNYCDVIVKRWENLTGKKATLAK